MKKDQKHTGHQESKISAGITSILTQGQGSCAVKEPFCPTILAVIHVGKRFFFSKKLLIYLRLMECYSCGSAVED